MPRFQGPDRVAIASVSDTTLDLTTIRKALIEDIERLVEEAVNVVEGLVEPDRAVGHVGKLEIRELGKSVE